MSALLQTNTTEHSRIKGTETLVAFLPPNVTRKRTCSPVLKHSGLSQGSPFLSALVGILLQQKFAAWRSRAECMLSFRYTPEE